ncbi:MAG: hypothetical protein ACD_46C00259G0003 [uncultured bacterium]|nr:MAG: hypothetical protein ACD_46C00259G0003 [uncultured bacterium]
MYGKRILLAAIGGLAAVTFSVSSFAVMSVPYGWYLEATGGSTQLSNKTYPGNSSSSGLGGSAAVGYKFMPYFTAELGYSLYANTSVKNGAGTTAGQDRHYSYDIAAKGILPFNNSGFETFAKLGVGRVASSLSIKNATAANAIGLGSSSHSATGLYMAAGAQYYFIPELAVLAEWARAQGNNSTGNLELYSLGLSFIFD